jgi:hypothetical protein
MRRALPDRKARAYQAVEREGRRMTKLDSNAAWKEASALVAANREVLFALAGVFFLIPSLAFAVFIGEPAMEPGVDREQMLAAMSEFYGKAWWLILLSSVMQIVGILAVLTLMRDRSRPTVGEAIAAGLGGTLSYLAAQLLFIVGLALVGGLLIGVLSLVSPVLGVVTACVMFLAAVFLGFRLILLAPVVAVEGQRNPITALRRSWALTQGHFWRIFAFVALVTILFLIVLGIIMLVVGLILAVATSGDVQRIIAAAISSALTAVAIVYFAGILAAIHRQLAGPRADT